MFIVTLVVAAAAGAETIPPDWPFNSGFSSYLLHVHPEVNYRLSPDWLAVWERERIGDGFFRTAVGSSASDELLLDMHWTLNPELAPRLRLRQDIVWLERRHLPADRLDIWLGLEWRVWRRAALVAQAVLAARKETIDLRLGWLLAGADRAQYVQLLLVLEDWIHDYKDRHQGVTDTLPMGLDWLVRLEHGPWTFFSEGRWVRGFARRYPDPWRSPVLASHRRAANEFVARVRWEPRPRSGFEAAWFQAEQAEARTYRNNPAMGDMTLYDHDYAGWYRLVSLRAFMPVSEHWRLRGELHRLHRRAGAEGWRTFGYRRDETMPALFAEWSWSARRTVELGYMGTFCRWRHQDGARRILPENRRGYADKIELALVLGLTGDAALKLSLSHEVNQMRFGGGSVRLLTGF